jgi:hypothetical protein
MIQSKRLFLMLNLILGLTRIWAIDSYQYSGNAVDLKTKEKLYTDNHVENIQSGKHLSSLIEYRDPSGKVFAKKNINFSKNPHLPDFKLEDFRDGYIEGSEIKGNNIRVYYRKNKDSKLEEKTFPIPPNPVVDGGFDYFIKDNWEKLESGQKLSFQMFAPSKLDYFKFKVGKVKLAKFRGRDAMYLKMELDKFLINAFLPSISIVYDLESKRIVHYEGISNINDPDGKSLFVRITYNHKQIK